MTTINSSTVEVTDFSQAFPKGTEFQLRCDEGCFGYEYDRDVHSSVPALPARRGSRVVWKRLGTAKKWLDIAKQWAAEPYGEQITNPRIVAFLPLTTTTTNHKDTDMTTNDNNNTITLPDNLDENWTCEMVQALKDRLEARALKRLNRIQQTMGSCTILALNASIQNYAEYVSVTTLRLSYINLMPVDGWKAIVRFDSYLRDELMASHCTGARLEAVRSLINDLPTFKD